MKISRIALAFAMATTCFAAHGFAQEVITQPASVSIDNTTYSDYYEASAPSPSDTKPVAVPGGDCGCNTCDSCNSGCRDCCNLGPAWELYPETCGGHKFGGWISAGVYSNEYGANSNGPLGFNDKADQFDLHQLWFYAGKKAKAGDCCWDWGYRVDAVFGVDGQDTQAFGNFNQQGYDNAWDGNGGDYGTALPQAYVELAYGNWSVIAGHFYTNIGYEVVQATGNFFYSHSYAQYYAEPFTHTGVYATYQYDDCTELYGGYVAGWDTGFDDGDDAATFLGGVKRQLSDDVSIAWVLNYGEFNNQSNFGGDIYMNSIVVEAQLTCNLKYVLQHDLGVQTDRRQGTARVADNEWYGINQYLFYTVNDCWGGGLRFEWFRDDDGARVITNKGGNAGNYYEVTAGINYRPRANFVIRPEIRYDWYDGTTPGGQPFNNGADDEQFSGGIDFVFTF